MNKLKILITCTILFMIVLFDLCLAQEKEMQNKPSETYIGMRNQIIGLSAKTVNIKTESPSEPWGIMMEMGIEDEIITLISLRDGTTSLYASNGGGIIGCGEHESVSKISKKFVSFAQKFISQMHKTTEYPLPNKEKVQFYILTESGNFTSDLIGQSELESSENKFFKLFCMGHEVITAVRKIDEKLLRSQGSSK